MKYYSLFFLFCLVFEGTVQGTQDLKNKEIIDSITSVIRQHELLSGEVQKLRELLKISVELEGLSLLESSENMDEKMQESIKDGIAAYQENDYQKAKDAFYLAWENDPNNYITNFNLGMSYQKVGNTPLAKKLLKTAVEMKPSIPGAKQVSVFLEGKIDEKKKIEKNLSEEEQLLRTEVINLKKEVDSYMKSPSLSATMKMKVVTETLNKILEKASNSDVLVREFYMDMVDVFSIYEAYGKALEILKHYEKSMEGQVLPDGYHVKKLQIENKKKEQEKLLKEYLNYKVEGDVKYKLVRDLHELNIFSAQMEEFVDRADSGDEDFEKICKRLREYRWGNRPERHVIVVDRFQGLLYSSPEGTLALDRYRDNRGRAFLKDITFLAGNPNLEKAKSFSVDLNVNGKIVPYMVLFTYVPRHEVFIIVRLPREDLL